MHLDGVHRSKVPYATRIQCQDTSADNIFLELLHVYDKKREQSSEINIQVNWVRIWSKIQYNNEDRLRGKNSHKHFTWSQEGENGFVL